uniref:NADH-ubiquinone oxidoreductase chain 3 n=1 Tax=Pedicinus obtusus TaxID=592408 RepID=A0A7L9CWJ8_9NEOP|nr:NADH dehydrogenase subunit 3 [Pedicinus obtusus]
MLTSLFVMGMVLLGFVGIFALMALLFSNEAVSTECDYSPFECGVMPFHETFHGMHISYYSVGILFLVFDIELVISIPLVFIGLATTERVMFWSVFSLILIMGLFMEIEFGSLDWKQ